MTDQSRSNQWFPEVNSLLAARQAARQGVWAALFVATASGIIALAATNGSLPDSYNQVFDESSWIDVVLFAIIAWGIYQMSRIAAVAGLILYGLSRIMIWATIGFQGGFQLFVTIAIISAFINAIRGTIAYHNLRRGV